MRFLRGYGVKDVLGRYVVLLHCSLVEIDLHLEDLPSVRNGTAGPHRGELRADESVLGQTVPSAQLGARERKLEDRHARGVVAEERKAA